VQNEKKRNGNCTLNFNMGKAFFCKKDFIVALYYMVPVCFAV